MACAASRSLGALLAGVGPADLSTHGTAALASAGTALVASALPATRAARVAPRPRCEPNSRSAAGPLFPRVAKLTEHAVVSLTLTLGGVLVSVLGLALLVVPAVPALGILFSGIVLIAWADGFVRIGWTSLGVLLVLTVAGSLADNVAALLGARGAGASGWGVAGAAIGVLAGLPFGLPGIVLGPAVGAFALEMARNPDLRRAGMAGLGGLAGFLLGVVARSVFAFLIAGMALLAYFY